MTQYCLSYGHSSTAVSIPGSQEVLPVEPRQISATKVSASTLVQNALATPCGIGRFSRMVRPGQTVAIVVSDVTRPCPTAQLLPHLLGELAQAGVDDKDVRIVFALGSHRRMTPAEHAGLVGPAVFERLCCDDPAPDQFVQVGTTSRGTPVLVYRPIVEAGWRIYVGNIEYHYFAGYTGGAKALLPGVCSLETIRANHSWMVQESATAGRIEGNPVREDIEEAATFVGPTFLLNVVLDGEKRIVEAVAGDITLAHRQGCRKVDELYRVPIAQQADIVLASAGGWPKDINLYQAHKALENAARAARDGGIVILLAQCEEGIGHSVFGEWLTCGDSPDELLRRIRERFVLGGHKAAAIAKTLRRGVRVFLVSAMEPALVRKMTFVPFASAQEALAAAQDELGHAASLAVMPHAGSTLPSLDQTTKTRRH